MRINYKEYLNSPEWKNKKKELFKLRGKECEQCGSTHRIHVHHLTYENFGNEPLEDLQILCYICHMSKHDEYFNKYILRVPQKTKKVVKEGYMVLDNKSINALRTKKGGIIKEVIDFLYTKKGRPKKGWLLKCIGNEVPIEKYNHIKEIVDNYSNKSYNRRQRDFILHNKKKRVSKEEKSDTIKKLQDMGVLTIDGRSLSKFTLRKLKTHLIQNIST